MRDFPFGLAVLLALLLHVLLGLGLRHNFLVLGSPAAARNNEPVSIRIVDVPSGGPTLEKPPNTRNFSDANRKAGPLEKTIRTDRPVVQAERPAVRAAMPSRPPGSARNATASPAPQQATQTPPAPLPPIQDPSTISSKGDLPIGDAQGKEKLSKSLQNLDQFLTPGGGTGGGAESGGDALQGDPGSGVYFDTRGFDLGPWANQVIAIVKRNWLIPVAAEMGIKGVVGVAFEVERSGEIRNVRLVSSSKIPSFDQAAMNALKSSSPFPPLPADFPRPQLPGVFRFYYNTPVPAN